MKRLVKQYLAQIAGTAQRGDAREESYYGHLKDLLLEYASQRGLTVDITVLPKRTEAGNPDFRVWDGETRIIGYIEAKDP